MLTQITTINNALCDVEKQYGVIFNRNSAVIGQDNSVDVLHLLVDTVVVPTIAPNERILSTLAIISPNNDVVICPIVAVQDVTGASFTGVKVIDSTGTLLQSGSIFPDPPKPAPETSGFAIEIGPSLKNLIVTTTQLPGGGLRIHAEGTVDFGTILTTIDILHFNFTITIGN